MSSIIDIIILVMTRNEIEILIEKHNDQEKERRNRILRARLARACSSEELIARLGALAEPLPRRERQIPLTNTSPQYIMEAAR